MSFSRYEQTASTSLDSYKIGHADQYPEGITKVYSNFTPRSEKHFGVPDEYKDGNITWFGMQMFLLEWTDIWQKTFFDLPWEEVEQECISFYGPFVGPNGYKTDRLKALHELGYLPLEIKSLPEGSRVSIGVPCFTVDSTLPDFAWFTNSNETWMSCELWKPSTAASISFVYRKILNEFSRLTGASEDFIKWQGHDFSMRGMSYMVDAAKTGPGHLVWFTGTDNLAAVKCINDAYKGKETFIGGSVPATEHSVMCAGGKESEVETFRRLIKTYPSGVVSIVSDTWNFWNVVGLENSIAAQLKDEILARVPDQFGIAKVVFRPDSGDPVKIIAGYKIIDEDNLDDAQWDAYDKGYEVVKTRNGQYLMLEPEFDRYENCFDYFSYGKELSESEAIGAVECLARIFGTTTNEKGFKTLNARVGLIYGDSITPRRAQQMLSELMDKGYASDNIVFGIGSYTFQYQTRDTLGFAMKATYVEIDGNGQAIFKDPITDSGMKKSARGLLCVKKTDEGKYYLINNATEEQEKFENELKTVFKDGKILNFETFAEIRERAESYL